MGAFGVAPAGKSITGELIGLGGDRNIQRREVVKTLGETRGTHFLRRENAWRSTSLPP